MYMLTKAGGLDMTAELFVVNIGKADAAVKAL